MLSSTTLRHATQWLAKDAANLHASAIDLQFAREGFGLIVGSITPICIATRALLAAMPGSTPPPPVVAHLQEHAASDGWRYFNHYRDIPPDTDDLALVLHVLQSAGVSPREPWVAAPLNHLAANRVSPGMFPTWLVAAPQDRTMADSAWASGAQPVHPEVVANMGHALLTLDDSRWHEDIEAAAHWLAKDPAARLLGNHWYYGSGYAGWLICHFLRAAHTAGTLDASASLTGYRHLLAGNQNDRGAWPLDRPPVARQGLGRATMKVLPDSVTETAWRMAALRCTGLPSTHPALVAAADYLASAQQADGGFPAEPFYETLSVEPYGSRTITVAAVLHALAPAD